jgi:hypothetical protein
MLVGPYFLVGLPGDVAGGDQDAELPVPQPGYPPGNVAHADPASCGVVKLGFQRKGNGHRVSGGPDPIFTDRVAAAVDRCASDFVGADVPVGHLPQVRGEGLKPRWLTREVRPDAGYDVQPGRIRGQLLGLGPVLDPCRGERIIMTPGDSPTPRPRTVRRQRVTGKDVFDPGADSGGDIQDRELGPVVLEPQAVLATPDGYQVLISGQLRGARRQNSPKHNVPAGAGLGEQEVRRHVPAGVGVGVSPVERRPQLLPSQSLPVSPLDRLPSTERKPEGIAQ